MDKPKKYVNIISWFGPIMVFHNMLLRYLGFKRESESIIQQRMALCLFTAGKESDRVFRQFMCFVSF